MDVRQTASEGELATLATLLERVVFELDTSLASDCQATSGLATARLRSFLTDREWAQLSQHGCLDVASPSVHGRRYRVPRAGGMVTLYQHDRPLLRLCVGPSEPLPRDDVVLLHLVSIRGDEQRYLETANPFPVRARGAR
jgi:hypothetical protein